MINTPKFALITFTALLFICACSKDNDDYNNSSNNQNKYTISEEIQQLSSQLFNTSWRFYKQVRNYDGYTIYSWPIDCVITFSDEPYNLGNNSYCLKIDGNYQYNCVWHIDQNGLWYSLREYGYVCGLDSFEVGAWSGASAYGPIINKTNYDLVINDGNNFTLYFKSTNSDDNGQSSYAPEIGFYDFTATKNTLTVQYRIYSGDVSSAKIYYGTISPSKSITASVSGKMITAKISGLSSGTKYYIKCIAKGSGGSTTSDTTTCITNY